MRFRVFGTEIYISFLFTAVISIMLATDRTGLALPSLFAVLMHEMGHLFCMWALDTSPKSVKLIPASVQITRSIGSSYKKDVAVALCGPIVNLILFLSLYFNYLAFGNKLTLYYALLNLIVCVFNMLPVKGLDGGTVLFSLLAKRMDYNRACIVLRFVTFIMALATLVVAVVLTVKGSINLSVYIISVYLIIMSIVKM